MSFGISVSDFVTLPTFAWKIYKSCKGSISDFKNVSGEVKALHLVLKRTQEQLGKHTLEPAQEAELNSIGGGCFDALNDLEHLLKRYNSLGTEDQRVRDRVRWGLADIAGIRQRLIANTEILTAFNSALTNSSLAQIHQKLDLLLSKSHTRERPSSIISVITVESLENDDEDVWRQLGSELRDIGISDAQVFQHRDSIIEWFKNAAKAGLLEERAYKESVDELLTWGESASDTSGLPTPTLPRQAAGTTPPQPVTASSEGANQEPPLSPLKYAGYKELPRLPTSLPMSEATLLRARLHLAVTTGDIDETNHLRGRITDISYQDEADLATLGLAAEKGHANVVKWLLDRGTDTNANIDVFGTALHRAALFGRDAVVRALIKRGADVNAKNEFHETPLHVTARTGHEALLRLLLEYRPAIDAQDTVGRSALHMAAASGHEAVVRLLVENHADVNRKDGFSQTPLHRAAMCGREAVVRLLSEIVDVNMTDGHGWSALYMATLNKHEGVIQLLLEKGAEINAKNEEGRTALHQAASSGDDDIVQLLVRYGAEIDIKDDAGSTALDVAIEGQQDDIVQLLTSGTSTPPAWTEGFF